MTRLLAAIALILVVLLAACGGGSSAVTLDLQADLSQLPAGTDADTALQGIADVMQKRATADGATNVKVETKAGGSISVTLEGIDAASARRLLTQRGVLGFGRPVIQKDGTVVCRTVEGDHFSLPPGSVSADSASRQPAHCFGNVHSGQVEWQPAAFKNGDQVVALTPDLIQPNGWTVIEDPSPALAAQFTDAGSRILQAITQALTGYPLGIFVDGELVGAPRIQRAITNGKPVISGFQLQEAHLRAAQLNYGPLAAPVIEAGASPATAVPSPDAVIFPSPSEPAASPSP